ncbi:hypothetical protein FEM33_22110 [Dyadobacter flavalbus]|uniref:Uncharacterized protein n=1 Tax=Dyadobacter flavalbus TaxID=2579942 RepID=A0A5M8QD82_9BACT|nr:hypothetical protein [Dyadobacter flavalbus]KAA6433987.1 hypothetical protein FEM33_22110 [Dyadobacter flavalbus]
MVKITKSLSVGLTTACFSTMLFMSSCSKEDALTPTPQSDVNQSSNLRVLAGGISANTNITPAVIPTTDGPTGLKIAPNGWTFPCYASDPLAGSPNATSNLTAFAGDQLTKWRVP